MNEDNKKYKVFSRRALITWGFKGLVFGLISWRFFDLQINDGKKYHTLSKQNNIKMTPIVPKRGIITDRKNIKLVTNKKSYSCVIHEENMINAEKIIKNVEKIIGRQSKISKHLENSSATLNKIIKDVKFKRVPLVIEDELSWRDISILELYSIMDTGDANDINSSNINNTNNTQDKNNFDIVESSMRYYEYGDILSSITGYVSSSTPAEVKATKTPYYQVFQVGKNGIEKQFDEHLQGAPSLKCIEVDVRGKKVRDLSYQPGTLGKSLQLTIDVDMQKIVHEAMKDKMGSVVIMDPYTGDVLAMYSAPTYDPNDFFNGITLDNWKKLANDQNHPLINKSIYNIYSPGSTFKVITALAALENNVNPEERVFCNGSYNLGNNIFHCHKKDGHGSVNLNEAIARSCNVYFYTIGKRIGIDPIYNVSRELGLGEKTGVELPYESRGLVPNTVWKYQRLKQKWRVGDTISASIGQGYVNATPIQLATAISRLVSGKYVVPHIVNMGDIKINNVGDININEKNRQLILKGMYDVFNSPGGTAFSKRIMGANFEMAGKTGTAQVISQIKNVSAKFKEHGLFIGFAPFDKPQYAISVVVEHGGWGSQSALPVGIDVLGKICV